MGIIQVIATLYQAQILFYEKPDLIFTGIDSSGSMIKLANENLFSETWRSRAT